MDTRDPVTLEIEDRAQRKQLLDYPPAPRWVSYHGKRPNRAALRAAIAQKRAQDRARDKAALRRKAAAPAPKAQEQLVQEQDQDHKALGQVLAEGFQKLGAVVLEAADDAMSSAKTAVDERTSLSWTTLSDQFLAAMDPREMHSWDKDARKKEMSRRRAQASRERRKAQASAPSEG